MSHSAYTTVRIDRNSHEEVRAWAERWGITQTDALAMLIRAGTRTALPEPRTAPAPRPAARPAPELAPEQLPSEPPAKARSGEHLLGDIAAQLAAIADKLHNTG